MFNVVSGDFLRFDFNEFGNVFVVFKTNVQRTQEIYFVYEFENAGSQLYRNIFLAFACIFVTTPLLLSSFIACIQVLLAVVLLLTLASFPILVWAACARVPGWFLCCLRFFFVHLFLVALFFFVFVARFFNAEVEFERIDGQMPVINFQHVD